MAALCEAFTLCGLGPTGGVGLGSGLLALEPGADPDHVLLTDRGRTATLFKVRAQPWPLGPARVGVPAQRLAGKLRGCRGRNVVGAASGSSPASSRAAGEQPLSLPTHLCFSPCTRGSGLRRSPERFPCCFFSSPFPWHAVFTAQGLSSLRVAQVTAVEPNCQFGVSCLPVGWRTKIYVCSQYSTCRL